MAIAAATGQTLRRTTSLPAIQPFTAMFWHRVDTNIADVTTFFKFGGTSGTGGYRLGYNTSGLLFSVRSEGHATVTGTTMVVGVWHHLALVVSGTGAGQALGYYNGVLDVTQNGNNVTPGEMCVAFWGPAAPGEEDIGSYAGFRLYTIALSAPQIAMEMQSYVPVHTTNLLIWSPWRDPSEAGINYAATLNWTVGGTWAVTGGPPMAWSRPQGLALSAAATSDHRWPFPPSPMHFWRRR